MQAVGSGDGSSGGSIGPANIRVEAGTNSTPHNVGDSGVYETSDDIVPGPFTTRA